MSLLASRFVRPGARSSRQSRSVLALAPLVLALVLGACAAPPTPSPGPGPEPEPEPALTVEFTQLNWLDDVGNVIFPFSRVGVAEIRFGREAAESFVGDGAFVNIAIDAAGASAWSVQNLFLRYPSAERMLSSSPSVQFAITAENGTEVSEVRYAVSVSAEPLVAFVGPPDSSSEVALADYHVGGRNGGGSGLSDIPLTLGTWVGANFFVGTLEEAAQTAAGDEELPAVDEDLNGCAPGAVARSIKYMLEQAGRESESVQDIYDKLKELMKTDDEGTADDDLLAGKKEYVEQNELPIGTRLVEYPAGAEDALGALAAGGDVEILIAWSGGGGHVAMVTSIVCLDNGQYQITYVDDPTQGDGKAEKQETTITVNADGSFDGGTIDGFVVETITS